ncbi:MAG TPA: glycosyltransferase family 2 protein [Phycisphaerae bacterium]|nr:glycosyltransferase family 2 protein [Phycisphaerae bacterium]
MTRSAVPSSHPEELPSVTIVLPVLNEARFVEDCLRSVLRQDYPGDKLEVLVLDGQSTDDTVAKAEAIATEDPRVRVLSNPGRWQSRAFNLGVRHARGEVIVRLDAHATYGTDYVRTCVETLARTGAANVGGVCRAEPGGEGLMARAVALTYRLRFGIGGARFRVGGQAGPVDTVPFGAFRKTIFEQVGLMHEGLPRGEDNEFNSRIRSHGLTVWFDPRIVVTYYARPTIRAFLRQMFGNGMYHIPTLMVNPAGCSPRHFGPFAFVMFLLACGLSGLAWTQAWWIGGGVFGLYLLAAVAAGVHAAARYGWEYMLVLPWLFVLVHMTYGIGTLAGVFRFGLPGLLRRRRKERAL